MSQYPTAFSPSSEDDNAESYLKPQSPPLKTGNAYNTPHNAGNGNPESPAVQTQVENSAVSAW